MGNYMVYMRNKEVVFTASLKTAGKLDGSGYERILHVEGSITGAAGTTLMSGRIWEEAERSKNETGQQ